SATTGALTIRSTAGDITINTNTGTSRTGFVSIIAAGNIIVNDTYNIKSGAALTLQADFDANGAGDINWNTTGAATMGTGAQAITYQQASSFSYTTITTKITNASAVTGGLTLRSTAGDITIDIATGASRTGSIIIYAAGNITQQADINAGAAQIRLLPDYDNIGGGEFSRTAGSIVTTGTLSIDKYSSMTLNGFTKTGAGSVYIGNYQLPPPASVTITGVITASSSSVYIYSYGDIAIGNGASVTSGGNLHLYADSDANGAGDITWTGTGAATLPITGALIYQSASSFNYDTITTKITGVSTATTGALTIRSTAGDITINTNTGTSRTGLVSITAAGNIIVNDTYNIKSGAALTLYADYDANGAGDINWNTTGAATMAITGALIYQQASSFSFSTITSKITGVSTATTGALTIRSTAGDITINTNTGASRTGFVSIIAAGNIIVNDTYNIKSGAALTLQADYDANSSGDITFNGSSLATMATSGTLTYQQASSFSYSTVTSKIINANATTSNLTLRSTAGNITIDAGTGAARTGAVYIYAAGDITQQANIKAGGSMYLYPDYDNIGGGEFIYTSGTINCYDLYINKYSSMTLNGFTKSGQDYVFIGSIYKPSSVTITGAISAFSSRNIYIYSDGDIAIGNGASVTSNGNLYLYADNDVSGAGDITWTGTGSATMGTTSALVYQQASSFSYSTVTAKITGGTTIGGLTLRSTAGNVTIDANTGATRTGAVDIKAAGNININDTYTVTSGNALTLQADYDVSGAGDINWNTTGQATVAITGSLTYQQASSFSYSTITSKITGVSTITSLTLRSTAGNVTIDANTGNIRTVGITIYAAGNININDTYTVKSGSALTLQADYDVSGLGDIVWNSTGAATMPANGALTYQQASSFSYSTVTAKITGGTIGGLTLRSTAGNVTIDANTGNARTGSVTIYAAGGITINDTFSIKSGSALTLQADYDVSGLGDITWTGSSLAAMPANGALTYQQASSFSYSTVTAKITGG
ncbi:MAG: hypothetical protein WC560_12935, partial [Syntrophales bacterium]